MKKKNQYENNKHWKKAHSDCGIFLLGGLKDLGGWTHKQLGLNSVLTLL